MKRLYRSRKNRMLGGVCGGIAEYFAIDPVIVRLIAVVFFFAGGSALLAYVIALIVIPYEPLAVAGDNKEAAPAAAATQVQAPQGTGDAVPLFLGILLIIIGAVFLLHNMPVFVPFYGWARHFIRHFFWPSLLIVFGIFIIARGWKK